MQSGTRQVRELSSKDLNRIGGGADWNGNGVDDEYEDNVESIGATNPPPTSGGYDYSTYLGGGGTLPPWWRIQQK